MEKKLKKFLILFDNESLLYFPGSFLSGQILVECEEDLPIFGLHFTIIGEGVVRPAGKKVKKRISENYINFRMQLLGDNNFNDPNELGRNENTLILPSGVHSFPFKLGLPSGIPSTFVGKHGWVQYFCKIALKDSSSTIHKNQQVFIVMNPIDLNLENKCLIQPIFCELIKKVGRFCGKKGTVVCRVRLDRGGYVPGESIKINARVENHSRITMKSSKATLNETIKYLSTVDGKILHSENKELASLSRGKIKPDTADEYREEFLYVPPIPPTNLRNCHLITIEFMVMFIVQVSKEKAIRMRLPIMLGTYPIRNPDGTLKKKGSYFPQHLPVSRPWLENEKK